MPLEGGGTIFRLNAQQSIDILFEPTFTDESSLTNSFAIYRDLYAGAVNIGLMGKTEKIVHAANACSPRYTSSADLSERTLQVNYCEAGLKFCYDQFLRTKYDYQAKLYTTAQGSADLSMLLDLFTMSMSQGIRLDVERVAWFGDSASTDINYNWGNGMFKHIENLIASGEIGYRIDSQQSTELTGQEAYELLRKVVKNAKPVLRKVAKANKRIHISGNLWMSILDYLQTQAVENGYINIFEEENAGIMGTYQGIPVVVHDRWDEILDGDFDLQHQNRIVYTTRDNFVIGTDLRPNALGGAGFFKVYQDPKTDEIFISSKFVYDANYIWPELISVGY